MDNESCITAFLTISELYFKMTTSEEQLVRDEEIDMLLANIDRSNLSIFFNNHRI